jgi:hypothetical protein
VTGVHIEGRTRDGGGTSHTVKGCNIDRIKRWLENEILEYLLYLLKLFIMTQLVFFL